MISLPEKHEVIEFFECEPQLTDPDVTWNYNSLKFELSKQDNMLTVDIQPSEEVIVVSLRTKDQPLVNINLCSVYKIELIDNGRILKGFSKTGMIEIEVSPRILLRWNCKT